MRRLERALGPFRRGQNVCFFRRCQPSTATHIRLCVFEVASRFKAVNYQWMALVVQAMHAP